VTYRSKQGEVRLLHSSDAAHNRHFLEGSLGGTDPRYRLQTGCISKPAIYRSERIRCNISVPYL
jgi:hypothetical protein